MPVVPLHSISYPALALVLIGSEAQDNPSALANTAVLGQEGTQGNADGAVAG